MTPPYEDLTALRRDADTLDRLAAGTEVPADVEREALVDVLVALRDEARGPLPELASTTSRTRRRPRPGGAHAAGRAGRGRKRAVAGAAVALVSMSLTGVAAAVGGDSFLAPIRAVIAQMTDSGGAGSTPEEPATVPHSVARLLEQSREALAAGDRAGAARFIGQARELAESVEGPAGDEAAAEVASVEGEVTGTAGSDAGSSDGATGSDAELGGSTADSSTSEGSAGVVEVGGATGNGGSFDPAGPGLSIAPGRAQPPGLGTAPGRDGAWVDPPRPQSTTSAETSDALDNGSDDGGPAGGVGGQVVASTPGASGAGSAGRSSREPSPGAGHSGHGAPEPRPGFDREARGGTESDRPGTRDDDG